MISNYTIADTKVYKYIMPVIASNMYILIKNQQALIIDPNENNQARDLLKSQKIKKVTIILTHEHYDHISGVNFFRENWNCVVYGNCTCKDMVTDPTKNMAAFFMAVLIAKTEEEQKIAQGLLKDDYSCLVDVGFEGKYNLDFEGLSIDMRETPGHSPGSICIVINHEYVFTGDSLVGGNKVITRLPGGSRKEYNQITRPFLESLPENMIVFPGHGEEGIIKEFQFG